MVLIEGNPRSFERSRVWRRRGTYEVCQFWINDREIFLSGADCQDEEFDRICNRVVGGEVASVLVTKEKVPGAVAPFWELFVDGQVVVSQKRVMEMLDFEPRARSSAF